MGRSEQWRSDLKNKLFSALKREATLSADLSQLANLGAGRGLEPLSLNASCVLRGCLMIGGTNENRSNLLSDTHADLFEGAY